MTGKWWTRVRSIQRIMVKAKILWYHQNVMSLPKKCLTRKQRLGTVIEHIVIRKFNKNLTIKLCHFNLDNIRNKSVKSRLGYGKANAYRMQTWGILWAIWSFYLKHCNGILQKMSYKYQLRIIRHLIILQV